MHLKLPEIQVDRVVEQVMVVIDSNQEEQVIHLLLVLLKVEMEVLL